MFLGIRTRYWLFLAASLVLIAGMVYANMSPVFAVRQVICTGPFADRIDDDNVTALAIGVNIFRVDKSDLAGRLLVSDNIAGVCISASLPHGLCLDINRFDPAALVLFDGRMYGLDRHVRLIPFDNCWTDIDLPILTGLKIGRLFDAPPDFRVAEVLTGLQKAKDDYPDLYGRIAEVNFSDRVYLTIHLTTGSQRFLAISRGFEAQLIKLAAIGSIAARSDEGCYNLQYDDIVIRGK